MAATKPPRKNDGGGKVKRGPGRDYKKNAPQNPPQQPPPIAAKSKPIHKKKPKKKKNKTKILQGLRHANEVKKPKSKHKWREARNVQKLKKVVASVGKSEFDEGASQKLTEIMSQVRNKGSSNTSNKNNPKKSQTESGEKESLRDRMKKRLDAARFRQINEELDSATNIDNPVEAFESDPELFQKYHDAYKGRMEHWPKNPLDVIIKWAKKKLSKDKIIADFGCGEARLSLSVPNEVHSFDLFALNERVTACDMTKVPLEDESVDAAVFCLSLMGTDVGAFIAEANRVLKINGLLKIAEVASRFSGNSFTGFLTRMKKFGFVAKQKGQKSHQPNADDDVFLMFEFLKIRPVKMLGKLPSLKLTPSVYKKR